MAAHDPNLPTTSTGPSAPRRGAVTRDSRDGRDTAAVIVWRTALDDTGATGDLVAGDSPLTPRLAHHLVAIYSDVHSTVVDLDADNALRHAAETAGRRYLAVTDLADLPAAPASRAAATLVVLRWPRPTGNPGQAPDKLLSACQQHLAADGSVIVAITAAAADSESGTRYAEHEQVLLPAAQAASLRHLHDIVPLPATDGRDTFTYTTARDDSTVSNHGSHAGTPRQTTSTTLVIFGHPDRKP